MKKAPSTRKVSKKLRALFKAQRGICHYCRTQMTLRRGTADMITIDHVVPKSQGGAGDQRNTVGACFACNNAKGDTPYEEFLRRVKANGRPESKARFEPERKIARKAKAKPIIESAAPWKRDRLAHRPYLDDIGKHNTLADALAAAGLAPKEEEP